MSSYAYLTDVDGKSYNNDTDNHPYLSTNKYSQSYIRGFADNEFFQRFVFFYFLLRLRLLNVLGSHKSDYDINDRSQSPLGFHQQNTHTTIDARLPFFGLLQIARNQPSFSHQSIANKSHAILCSLFDKILLWVQANVSYLYYIRLCHQLQGGA